MVVLSRFSIFEVILKYFTELVIDGINKQSKLVIDVVCFALFSLADTRETAFVNAITAAGIAFTIAKACSMGELVECSCDKNLVRHNVLLNNHQMTTTDNTMNPNMGKNNKNRSKKPRRNGDAKNRQRKSKNQRRTPPQTPLPTVDASGQPVVGENWEWSGCDDNVNFGNRKSKDFLDARLRRRSDIKTLVKIHNNDAGRLVSSLEPPDSISGVS